MRIKLEDYLFYVTVVNENTVVIQCEQRRTFMRYSSGEVELKRLKSHSIPVALERTSGNITHELVNADAKLILTVKVNYEFLPLISE